MFPRSGPSVRRWSMVGECAEDVREFFRTLVTSVSDRSGSWVMGSWGSQSAVQTSARGMRAIADTRCFFYRATDKLECNVSTSFGSRRSLSRWCFRRHAVVHSLSARSLNDMWRSVEVLISFGKTHAALEISPLTHIMWTDRKHTGNDNNNDAQLLTCHMSTDTVKVIMLNRRHGIDDTNTHSSQLFTFMRTVKGALR